jgi:hypothetical protein
VRAAGDPVEFRLARSRERYLEEIAECRRLLAEGETYEVCLTNRVVADIDPDRSALYRSLRRVNPAPFSAFLRFGERAVFSSSPERFLRVGRDRWVEGKPIKGTCRAGRTPAEDVRLAERLRGDEKNRAENLMIADLLRNDLGAVCEIGTVHVPHLMQVETYETCTSSSPRCAASARRAHLAGLHSCLLPAWLDDRRAEAAHDADHRPARGGGPRRLLAGDRLPRASAVPAISASRSGRSSSTATRRLSGLAARLSRSPIRRASSRRCC